MKGFILRTYPSWWLMTWGQRERYDAHLMHLQSFSFFLSFHKHLFAFLLLSVPSQGYLKVDFKNVTGQEGDDERNQKLENG